MARQKKNLSIQIEEKQEAKMSEENSVETLKKELENSKAELEKVNTEIRCLRKLENSKAELEKVNTEIRCLRELDEKEKKINEKLINTRNEMKTIEDKIERQRAYDNEKVTGRFINRRAPGQIAKLTYLKNKGDVPKWDTFVDGRTYTIPRGYADQINEHYHTPVFIQKQGEQVHSSVVGENSVIAEVDRSNKKYAFVPCSF